MNKTNFFLLLLCALCFMNCKDDDDAMPAADPVIDDFVSYFSFNNNLNDTGGFSGSQGSGDNIFYTDGVNGQGLEINENSSSIFFDQKTFRDGSNISISIWVKTSTISNTWHIIWCDDFTIFTSDNRLGMTISIPNTDNAHGEFEINEWTHLVGTYDGNSIKSYINGVFIEETIHPGEISSPDRFLEIKTNSNWTGALDEFYIFDRVLSAEEAKLLFEL